MLRNNVREGFYTDSAFSRVLPQDPESQSHIFRGNADIGNPANLGKLILDVLRKCSERF